MRGESPTRPGILNARPEVVVVPARVPFRSSARHEIVPVRGWVANQRMRASAGSGAAALPTRAAGAVPGSASNSDGPQSSCLLCVSSHSSQILRELLGQKLLDLKPVCDREPLGALADEKDMVGPFHDEPARPLTDS